jgi:hypothetical protein
MLAHAQVVVGTPDDDATRAARRMPDRAGKHRAIRSRLANTR